MLTPLELIDCLAALIPPPCRHRHRYYGVLAPNAPPRMAPARGPPLWEVPVAGLGGDLQAQPSPNYEFDQRIA